tara:strand:- start:24002 stop:24373 length:372 start_codon:yes stop_codon:yes gene_type:complete
MNNPTEIQKANELMTASRVFHFEEIQPSFEKMEKNRNRKRSPKCDNDCYICGRGIVSDRAVWVEMLDGFMVDRVKKEALFGDSDIYNLFTYTPELPDHMGAYPVGPACAKKIPANFKRPEVKK